MDDDGGAPGNHRNGSTGGALPRRSAQGHLEPQLRETRGTGNGTPFTAFAPVTETETPDDAAGDQQAGGAFAEGGRRSRPSRGD